MQHGARVHVGEPSSQLDPDPQNPLDHLLLVAGVEGAVLDHSFERMPGCKVEEHEELVRRERSVADRHQVGVLPNVPEQPRLVDVLRLAPPPLLLALAQHPHGLQRLALIAAAHLEDVTCDMMGWQGWDKRTVECGWV